MFGLLVCARRFHPGNLLSHIRNTLRQRGFSSTRSRPETRLKCGLYDCGASPFQTYFCENYLLIVRTKHSFTLHDERDVHPMVKSIGYSRRCIRCVS